MSFPNYEKMRKPIDRLLESYGKRHNYKDAQQHLIHGQDEYMKDKVKNAKMTIDGLLSRHLDYYKIEEFIANSPVLLKYHDMAYNECAKNKNYTMISVMILALEKIADTLLEYEKGYEHMPQPELVKRIKELESENEEFRSTLSKLGDIYDVIGKCRNSSGMDEEDK